MAPTQTGAKKRLRANTAGDDHGSPLHETKMSLKELTTAVASLDKATVRRLLVQAAHSDPSLAGSILKEVYTKKLEESQEEIDFSIFTNQAQDSIDRGLRHKPSKQFHMAYGVVSDVNRAISSVEKKVAARSSFATKIGALTALCEIGELVVDSAEKIGKALKTSCSEDSSLEDAMEAVLSCMTDAERASLRTQQEGMEFGESLEALVAEGNNWGVFSELESIHTKYFA